MEGEQFSLCWNNFHTNLSSGFHSLFKDEDLVDVTLAAEGKFLKAHKTVLSVCSPFFKDLFRVNPCKHPIVILPDVNYNALCGLLHFMYQGEVSVSQEEIPTFMRVAEMLKVKGLTDNSNSPTPSETNGYTNSSRGPFGCPDQRQNIMKRPRPVKKIIRPTQPLRPIESPKPDKSPQPHHQQSSSPSALSQPPPNKKPLVENDQQPIQSSVSSAQANQINLQMPLLKPKVEPLEQHDEDNTSHSGGDTNVELRNMLENSQEEPSPSHPFPSWPPFDVQPPPSQDSSSPGTIQCILGKRGCPRLIVDGYVFYKKSVYKGKAFWYCKNSRTPEKCQAVCWTMNGNIVKWPYMHCHPPIPDTFNPEEDTEVPIENLQEVLWQTSIN